MKPVPVCPVCHGTGRPPTDYDCCPACRGTGRGPDPSELPRGGNRPGEPFRRWLREDDAMLACDLGTSSGPLLRAFRRLHDAGRHRGYDSVEKRMKRLLRVRAALAKVAGRDILPEEVLDAVDSYDMG